MMCTGDHLGTALSVASRVGMTCDVITVEKRSDAEEEEACDFELPDFHSKNISTSMFQPDEIVRKYNLESDGGYDAILDPAEAHNILDAENAHVAFDIPLRNGAAHAKVIS